MMTLGEDVKRVKEAMTSPPKKPVRFGPDPYTHIEKMISRLRSPGWVGKQFQKEEADTMADMLAVVRAARDLSDGCAFPVDFREGELHNELDKALDKLETNDPQKQEGN